MRPLASRLVRVDLIAGLVMLGLSASCYGISMLPVRDPVRSDQGTLGIVLSVLIGLPYGILLLLAALLLKRFPRVGLAAHVVAWCWPVLAVIGSIFFGVWG